MVEVPADYLLWLFRQSWIKDWPDIYEYLVLNQAALELEEDVAEKPQGEFTSYEDNLKYGRD